MNALKPCPFCGGEATENRDISNSIYCKKCFAEIDTDCVDWNIRPIEDALQSRIAELEAENDRLQGAWFKDETICPDGSLKPKVSTLLSRIAELERDVKWREESISTIEHALANNEDDIEMLESRIAELEAEIDQLTADSDIERQDDKWIPVSERLPDNWESVLTIDMSKSTRDMVTAFYNPETSLWSTHFSCDLWVTHWMPLPELPIMYGKVCEE